MPGSWASLPSRRICSSPRARRRRCWCSCTPSAAANTCRCRWRWPRPAITSSLLQQPLPGRGLRVADGEGGGRPGRLHPRRQGAAGLRARGAGRLERRRLAVRFLPGRGRVAQRQVHPGRRALRPGPGPADPRRRADAAGGPRQPRGDAHREPRRLPPRRVRPRAPQPRAGPLRSAQPEPPALRRRLRRALPRRADRAQPPHHRLGA